MLLRGLGRLNVFPGDDVGAQNKLKRLLAIETPLGYEAVRRLVARWQPFAGVVYFHLLLDSLTRSENGARPGKSSARGTLYRHGRSPEARVRPRGADGRLSRADRPAVAAWDLA